MTVTRTGAVGEMMKLNVLSAASASADNVTVAFMLRPPASTGSNSTDWVPPGSRSTGLLPCLMPFTSSAIVVPFTAVSDRLITPAFTATRSWPENVERASDTAVTLTLGLSVAPEIGTVVTMVPFGSRMPSSPRQPLR